MATKLLNQRIKDIVCYRKSQSMDDVLPTLQDIEKTHILYVNAHFKPFCAIAFEYHKVQASSGVPNLGATITFSLPTFGDFFFDMVAYLRLSAANANLRVSPSRVLGNPNFGVDNPDTGISFALVDAFGNVRTDLGTTAGSYVSYQNLVRYCEYPGNRVFKYSKFSVNGNILDEYWDYTSAMLQKFTIPPNKVAGYNRLVGQENPLTGYSGPIQSEITDHQGVNGPAQLIASQYANLQDYCREVRSIVNGPQTPKLVQPALEIWHKYKFWFNEDVRLAVPAVSIPYGQRFITMDLQPQENLIFEFSNLYVKTTTSTVDDASHTASRKITYTPIVPDDRQISDLKIEAFELYVNNIFVNTEIHDIFIERIGFSLIRVYRHQVANCTSAGANSVKLEQLKWPIEYMFVGVRPTYNISAANPNQWRDWHRMTYNIDAQYDLKYDIEQVDAASPFTDYHETTSDFVVPPSYTIPVPTVDSVTITSHSITIFDNYGSTFFNSYLPLQYGGPAINTPEDIGALMVNFAIYPRSYQPSGHFNLSRARETFINFVSRFISPTNSADLIVVAIAIKEASRKQEAMVLQSTCSNAFMNQHEIVQPPSPCMIDLAF
jgi:hypothetical protein